VADLHASGAELSRTSAHRGSSAAPVVSELDLPVVTRRMLPVLVAALLAIVALVIWRAQTHPVAPMPYPSVAAPGASPGDSPPLGQVPDAAKAGEP
jgi:hypothetical protein